MLAGSGFLGVDAGAATTELISVNSAGEQHNFYVDAPSLSADGRFVAFSSYSTNLVPFDTNGTKDVFVRNRVTGQTERVSVAGDGTQGNDMSQSPSISNDGVLVAFMTTATNLVPGDTNNLADIYVFDRSSGVPSRISIGIGGSQSNGSSSAPNISTDGRFVAFQSEASNLVANDTNYSYDCFVHDRTMGVTERVSVSSSGEQGNGWSGYPVLSADGRFVVFRSFAGNLVPGDANGVPDIFIHDRQTHVTERVSIATDGTEGNGQGNIATVSADGRYVAFDTQASNLAPNDVNSTYDVFVRDRLAGTTDLVSVNSLGEQANADSFLPMVSDDGRYVTFASAAGNLVPDDTNAKWDVFLHDRWTGITERVSVGSAGEQGNGSSYAAYGSPMTQDGRLIVFLSEASNLTPGDANGKDDIFLRVRDIDADADGFDEIADCDDTNAAINPGAVEICDGIDNNCNGLVDERYITATAGGGGTISPPGNILITCGGSQCFTITPNVNNKIADVLVDGVSVGPLSSYCFSNVSANHSISASFAPYTLVTVIQPNGGEVLASGSSYAIKWGAPTTAVKFNLAYSTNNGSSYTTIANGVTGFSYNWAVAKPAANSPQCKVRVIGLDSRGKTVGTDASDVVFTIEVIRVTSPNGGEIWQRGAAHAITWITNATSQTLNKVTLSYSINGGSTWTKIADLTSNPGTYNWMIPTTINSTTCRVKVNLFRNSTSIGMDTSNANFTIKP